MTNLMNHLKIQKPSQLRTTDTRKKKGFKTTSTSSGSQSSIINLFCSKAVLPAFDVFDVAVMDQN